jgi:predicted Fe-S protein YdhL (DUF1289 family)
MNFVTLGRPSQAELDARAQAAQTRHPTPSPCTSVCQMNPDTGWCEGCFRSIDEIIQWSALDDAAKRAIWQALPGRRVKAGP